MSAVNAEENEVRNKVIQAKKQLEELQLQKQQTMTDVERLAAVKKVLVLEDDTKKRE